MKKLFTILFVLMSFLLNAQKGTFIDARDNKTYKTIKIGDQTWMSEDLKFKTKKCDTINWFYDYETIMNEEKPDTIKIKGICPDGWHIPSVKEWNDLLLMLHKAIAGEKLRENGFNTTFKGRYNADNKIIENTETHSYYWSSTERDFQTAWVYYLYSEINSVGKIDGDKKFGYSLRCIKDK